MTENAIIVFENALQEGDRGLLVKIASENITELNALMLEKNGKRNMMPFILNWNRCSLGSEGTLKWGKHKFEVTGEKVDAYTVVTKARKKLKHAGKISLEIFKINEKKDKKKEEDGGNSDKKSKDKKADNGKLVSDSHNYSLGSYSLMPPHYSQPYGAGTAAGAAVAPYYGDGRMAYQLQRNYRRDQETYSFSMMLLLFLFPAIFLVYIFK